MNFIYYTQLKKFYDRVTFYIGNFACYLVPRVYYRWFRPHLLASLSTEERNTAERRAAYYCRVSERWKEGGIKGESWTRICDFTYPWKKKHKYVTYFFDLYNSLKYHASDSRFSYLFGDVNYEPDIPSFVKSRPIAKSCTNGVVMKLNQVRHFRFVDDNRDFTKKKDMLVCRFFLSPNQPQRERFMKALEGSALCDIGIINEQTSIGQEHWKKTFMPISKMLDYKFVACIEGNDVATSLKWVMSSNSIAVMPCPKFETWFMEGQLRAGFHYIEVREDYADLEEKIAYYIAHPDESLSIIKHAHEHVSQFKNLHLERAISILTAERYFKTVN